MAKLDVVPFDAAIPGQSLTAELGSRPWQQPAQYTTVEEALDYYIPRLQSDEVSAQLLDVLEMGIPVTTVANTMQLGSVMEGKHSVDVGMLILPVLVELIMLIADTANVKYTSGLEKDKEIRGSVVDLAVKKFKDKDVEQEEDDTGAETTIKEMKEAADERATGLMSRRMQ
tara:strand:+ start:1252 stop:1764 length:513 start_codon:yes stop_codon:yes gene_type:complete